MPKDKSKNGGKKKRDEPEKDAAREAVDAIRSAFERTLAATAGSAQETRERAQGLVDEIGAAAGRVRQAIEEVDLLDELRGLRGDLETLARRVAALERRTDGDSPAAGATDEAPATPAAASKRAAKASKSAKGKRAATGKAAKGTRTAKRSATGTSAGTATARGGAKGAAKSAKRGSAKRGSSKRAPSTDTADDAGSGRS